MPEFWIDEVRCQALTPTEADVYISMGTVDPGVELQGRLTGPRCVYSTTIEVAYRWQPLPRRAEEPTRLQARVVIPEPCFWEPETPFVYSGQVEAADAPSVPLTVGLRTVQWRGAELRVNGRPFDLRSVRCKHLSADAGRRLRADGVNCLVVPVAAATAAVWDAADRLGFFVVGELPAEELALARALRLHPCHLGWLPAAGASPTVPPHWAGEWRDPALFATIRDLSSE